MKNEMHFVSSRLSLALAVIAIVICGFACGTVAAQQPERGGRPARGGEQDPVAEQQKEEPKENAPEKDAKDKKPEKILAITGGDI